MTHACARGPVPCWWGSDSHTCGSTRRVPAHHHAPEERLLYSQLENHTAVRVVAAGVVEPLRLVSRLQSNTRAIDVWGSGVVSLPSLVRVSHAAGPGVIVDQVARYLGWLRHAWPLSAESRVVRCRTTAGLQRCGATAGTEALWIVPRWQWVQPDMHGHSNLCPGLKQALR